MESLPHVVWTASFDGAIEYVNRHGAEYFGEPAEDLLGWSWSERVHPDDLPRVQAAWIEAVRSAGPYELAVRMRIADRGYRWVLVRARLVRAVDGGEDVWVGSTTDVHEQRLLEEGLRGAEHQANEALALLDTLQSNAPVGFGFVDLDLRYVRVNDALAERNGVPVEAHIGRPVAEIVPDLWPSVEQHYRRVVATGEPVTDVDVSGLTSADDDIRHWLVNYFPVAVAGELVGVGVVVVETTGQKRLVDQVETRLDQQAVLAHLGSMALSEPGVNKVFDHAVAQLAAVMRVEMTSVLELELDRPTLFLRSGVGWRPGLVGTGRITTDPDSVSGLTLAGDGPFILEDLRAETRFRGSPILLEHGVVSGMSTIIRADGRPWGVLGVHTRSPRRFSEDDVNFLEVVAHVLGAAVERRLAREREREAGTQRRRLLGELMRVQEAERRRVADEIHDDALQLLSVARLRVGSIEPEGAAQREAMAKVEQSLLTAIERLRGTLSELRPHALAEAGLAAAIDQVLAELADDGVETELRNGLSGELSRTAGTVAYRIVCEAVMNARKHAGANRLEVDLEEGDGAIAVRVRDDGCGFDPARAESNGHFGLLTMRERAEAAGGILRVSSRPGCGTTVAFEIPAA